MNLLLDQDVWEVTAQFLIKSGHDVLRVADVGRAQAYDEELLQLAHALQRVFLTRDRDFGRLVFVTGLGAGVVYLRILPSTQGAVHHELARVLETYTSEELKRAFVVIQAGGHRFRSVVGRAADPPDTPR